MATTARFTGATNKDNTDRAVYNDYQAPVYASTITIAFRSVAYSTVIKPGILTGALTLIAGVGTSVTPPFVNDRLKLILTADSTARVVTFSTGFATTAAVTVGASSVVYLEFFFNGTSWQLISTGTTRVSTGPDVQTPAYAATLSVTTSKVSTVVIPGQLTGALTINMVLTGAVAGDSLRFAFSADGTDRVVTFGTGLKSSGTLTVAASKFGAAEFLYDGTEFVQIAASATA